MNNSLNLIVLCLKAWLLCAVFVTATQGAAYLQFRYSWQYGLPAYIGAGLVGLSLVQNDHHYWLTNPYEGDFVVTPTVGPDAIGFNGHWTF